MPWMLMTLLSLQPAAPGDDAKAVIETQAAEWNRGNLAGFLSGYEDSPDTVFVSGATVETGFAAVKARYLKKYGTRAAMGTLNFKDLKVRSASDDTAVISGAWEVVRTDKSQAAGRFTLLLRKRPGGWKIVYDHTS